LRFKTKNLDTKLQKFLLQKHRRRSEIVKKADILILGAGCSGTSLAHYLENFGYTGKVVLLDSRTNFDREQRWCSWSEMPQTMSGLVQKSWQNWTVCDENYSTTQTSEKFSYKQIYAPQFFSHFHSNWKNAESKIELSLGERAEKIFEQNGYVEVVTNQETWHADLIFDARHEGSNKFDEIKKTKEVYLHQTFLGWEIEFSDDVFDEQKATLMDFRTIQIEGVNFIYVLPYTKKRALIESTSFSRQPLDLSKHSQAVEKYIAENYGNKYEIRAVESGQLPMTSAKFPVNSSNKIFNIGIAGGNARPSSGYAFHRIQRQTSEIAKAIVNGKNLPKTFAHSKYNFFDDVFLNLIAQNPNAAKNAFIKLFDKVSPDTLIRFLTEESSVTDDLAIISALPKVIFGKLGWQSILRKLTAKDDKTKSFTIISDPVAESARRFSAR
jgi:lycopene beta-cyclase